MPQYVDESDLLPEYVDESELMPATSGVSKLESAARGGLQGMTLGWADEIGGALGAIAEPFITGEANKPGEYERQRDAIRKANDAARTENPSTYGASELVAGIAAPVPGAALLRTGSAAAKIGKAGLLGAGVGAVQSGGSSTADTAPSLAEDVATGAAVGGVTGGVVAGLSATSPTIKKIAKWVAAKSTGLTEEQVSNYIANNPAVKAARNPKEILAAISKSLKDLREKTGQMSHDVTTEVLDKGQTIVREATPDIVSKVPVGGAMRKETTQSLVRQPSEPNQSIVKYDELTGPVPAPGEAVTSEFGTTVKPRLGPDDLRTEGVIPGAAEKPAKLSSQSKYVPDDYMEGAYSEKVIPGTPAKTENLYRVAGNEVKDAFDSEITRLKGTDANESKVGESLISKLEELRDRYSSKDREGRSAKNLIKNLDRDMAAYKKEFPEGSAPPELISAEKRIRAQINARLKRTSDVGPQTEYAQRMDPIIEIMQGTKGARKTFGKGTQAELSKVEAIGAGKDTIAKDALESLDKYTGQNLTKEAQDYELMRRLKEGVSPDVKLTTPSAIAEVARTLARPVAKGAMDTAVKLQPTLRATSDFLSKHAIGVTQSARIMTKVKDMVSQGSSDQEIEDYVNNSVQKGGSK